MRKLFLGIICLFFMITSWSCQQNWPVPKNKSDISVGEMFSGATWSDDSQKVYFARWVVFGSAGEMAQREKSIIDDKWEVIEKINSICPWVAPVAANILFNNIPGPLYRKVVVYSYDLSTHTIQIVAILPYNDMSPVFFFSNSLADNKISFCSAGGSQVHSIDLFTGQDMPIKGDGCQSIKKGAMITVETPDFVITKRYLSPDRHSFIEILSNMFATNEIKIFNDPSINLKTMAELGGDENLAASTASKDEITAWQANMAKIRIYQATEKISPELLYTPEEKEIRARFGI